MVSRRVESAAMNPIRPMRPLKSILRVMSARTVSTTSSFVVSTSKPLISRETKEASTPIRLFPSMNG